MAGLKTGHYNAAEQPSCRQLAGRDLVPSKPGTEFVDASQSVRKLTLRELEALARALLPVFLALFHTRVAREKTVLA